MSSPKVSGNFAPSESCYAWGENGAATLVLWFRLGRKLLLSDPFCASIKGELEEVERITNFEN
jgi:hypothetical protein